MSEQFYSVKSAPLVGVDIEWFHVQVSNGVYVYMLSQNGVARATKTHRFKVSRFCQKNGWKPSPVWVSGVTTLLELNVKAPDGKEYPSQLLTVAQVTDYIAHLAKDGDEYGLKLLTGLAHESLEQRFDQLFNKPLKPVEVKDAELTAKLTMEIQEQVIRQIGQRLQAAGGSASKKREFLNLLLEGHTAKELVAKELTDSTGKVLRKAGGGRKRAYTKLNLVDPTHREALRHLYHAIALEMCFVPVGTEDYLTQWHSAAVAQLKRSKLPHQVKLDMVGRVTEFCLS